MGCKSLKARYCNTVCQRADWSSHKPTCLSIRAASNEGRMVMHLAERALVVPTILLGLEAIMIRELKLGTSDSISMSHALKVICGLTSVDCRINVRQLVRGGRPMAGGECCFTFLSFTTVPLDSIPPTCYTQVCLPHDGIRVALWFVVEELGNIHSSTTSLLDLSFAVEWSVSSLSAESIGEQHRAAPEHASFDYLRLQVNTYLFSTWTC
ncbi:hypothetical protein OF83DRAFT_1171472 [Amylostereum chailletii]|nr:hypothetical protein OF83DRAFT_1171472 [Amylostereum chailletii]